MKASFRFASLELAFLAMVVISANASASDSINGTSRAIVIAPVNVSDTVLTYSTSALFGVTANLTIRLPGGSPPRRDSGYLNPVSTPSSTVVSNDCLQKGRTLVSCINHVDEDGMLKGDPVSNILLDAVDDTQSARNHVGITVTYN